MPGIRLCTNTDCFWGPVPRLLFCQVWSGRRYMCANVCLFHMCVCVQRSLCIKHISVQNTVITRLHAAKNMSTVCTSLEELDVILIKEVFFFVEWSLVVVFGIFKDTSFIENEWKYLAKCKISWTAGFICECFWFWTYPCVFTVALFDMTEQWFKKNQTDWMWLRDSPKNKGLNPSSWQINK